MVRFNKGASQYEADFSLFHKTRPVDVPWQSMKQLRAGKALRKKRHLTYKFELGQVASSEVDSGGERTEPESLDTGESDVDDHRSRDSSRKSCVPAGRNNNKKDRAIDVKIGFAAD